MSGLGFDSRTTAEEEAKNIHPASESFRDEQLALAKIKNEIKLEFREELTREIKKSLTKEIRKEVHRDQIKNAEMLGNLEFQRTKTMFRAQVEAELRPKIEAEMRKKILAEMEAARK